MRGCAGREGTLSSPPCLWRPLEYIGMSLAFVMPALQVGQVSRSFSSQRYTHFQQYKCPQGVTTGSSGLSRQISQIQGLAVSLAEEEAAPALAPPPARLSIFGEPLRRV